MSLLEVKNLHTFFRTKKGIVKAVNDVTYSLEPARPSASSASPAPARAFPP